MRATTATLAVSLLVAVVGAAGAVAVGCGGSDDGESSPPGGEPPGADGSTADGVAVPGDGAGPIELDGGGGPGVVVPTCPKLAMPTGAATVHVDASAAAGGTGTKAAPYRTIAEAFASAGASGVVWVAAGTYKESLTIPNQALLVQGGFAPGFGSRTDACATVLEAASTSQPVLTAPSAVKSFALEGVTVQNGSRGLSVSGDSSVGATFTITSTVFAGNGSPGAIGGGAYLDRVSATISRSVFRDNRAEKGAAISLGGDLATITIEESLFERNVGHSDHGGALYLSPKSGTITRSTFRSNEIGKTSGYGWGGAVIVYKAGAAPVTTDFSYNVFTDNLASVGGAVFVDDGASITMSHDLLYRNRSIEENGVARGAALYVDGLGGPGTGSTLVADHLTVVGNARAASGATVTARGGGVYLETYSKATFTSSIFWGNGDETLFGDPTCEVDVRYSIAPGACAGGSTCTLGAGVFLPTAVEFVDEAASDYHEKSTAGHYHAGAWVNDAVTSPAVDKADPAGVVTEPLPNGGRANLGVYGRTAEASKSP